MEKITILNETKKLCIELNNNKIKNIICNNIMLHNCNHQMIWEYAQGILYQSVSQWIF